MQLTLRSSFLSLKSVSVAVAAAMWPPAEPPLARILLGSIPSSLAWERAHLMADFASLTHSLGVVAWFTFVRYSAEMAIMPLEARCWQCG